LERHPEELCEMPVSIGRGVAIPKCLDMITAKMVIDRIKLHFDGGAYFYDDHPPKASEPIQPEGKKNVHEEKQTRLGKRRVKARS
jgi:hypothetical protein